MVRAILASRCDNFCFSIIISMMMRSELISRSYRGFRNALELARHTTLLFCSGLGPARMNNRGAPQAELESISDG